MTNHEPYDPEDELRGAGALLLYALAALALALMVVGYLVGRWWR